MNQILEVLKKIRPDVDFETSTDFIEDYLLDSFDIMTLTSTLEKKYKITIPSRYIVPDNYKSVEAITNMVEKCGSTV